jgi:hypothetical protein
MYVGPAPEFVIEDNEEEEFLFVCTGKTAATFVCIK